MDKASRPKGFPLPLPCLVRVYRASLPFYLVLPLLLLHSVSSSVFPAGGSVAIPYNRTSFVQYPSYSLPFGKRAVVAARNGIDVLDDSLFRLYFNEAGKAAKWKSRFIALAYRLFLTARVAINHRGCCLWRAFDARLSGSTKIANFDRIHACPVFPTE